MSEQFVRTEMLLGKDAMEKLRLARVAVFGVGGVGGYVCEALVRSGVGAFDLIDNDTVSLSNLNRQIIALHSTIGRLKVEVMKERMLDINPMVQVRTYPCFFLPGKAPEIPFEQYDYVVDAVDTVTAKLEIIMNAKKNQVPVISSMGTGNKLDGGRLCVADIYETTMCPLAKVMRKELRKRGVESLKVVYSQEPPRVPVEGAAGDVCLQENCSTGRRSTPGSTAFVPSAAGLLIAGEVIRDLAGL